MKTYTKKIIFGGVFTISLSLANIVLLQQENANEMWYAIVFLFAMKGGVILWLVLLVRERSRLKEENFRRKNK